MNDVAIWSMLPFVIWPYIIVLSVYLYAKLKMRLERKDLHPEGKPMGDTGDGMKLRDALPSEALSVEFSGDKFRRYLDYEVTEEIMEYDSRFPFKHKNIHVWWILEDNIAVGWNENRSRGWSFPVAKIKEVEKK